MRIETEPARTDDEHMAPSRHRAESGGRWSDDEIARLRSEWDVEPGHR